MNITHVVVLGIACYLGGIVTMIVAAHFWKDGRH
jgi:hypothetical protein